MQFNFKYFANGPLNRWLQKRTTKARFPLQPYRSEMKRISLSREHSGRSNDMDTIEYATFRYDTFEVENGHKI